MNTFRWLIAIAACTATFASAGLQSFPLWGKTVNIPEPTGLVTASNASSRYYTNALAGQDRAGNKLLAVYLEPTIVAAVDGSMPFPPLETWGNVTHAKSVANEEFTTKDFKTVADQACPSVQKGLEPATEKWIGIVGRADRFRTCGFISKLEGKSGTRSVVTLMTFVLAKGRLLTATYYRTLRDPKELDSAKQEAAAWARAIVAANP